MHSSIVAPPRKNPLEGTKVAKWNSRRKKGLAELKSKGVSDIQGFAGLKISQTRGWLRQENRGHRACFTLHNEIQSAQVCWALK